MMYVYSFDWEKNTRFSLLSEMRKEILWENAKKNGEAVRSTMKYRCCEARSLARQTHENRDRQE